MPTKIFQSKKIASLIFSDFFSAVLVAVVAPSVENLPFSLLSAIIAETMQKRGILPMFCATCPTPPVQNIAIPATQKLTDCVSKPIGYPHSHLHTKPPKNAPRPLKSICL